MRWVRAQVTASKLGFTWWREMARGRSSAGLKYKPLTAVLRMQVDPQSLLCTASKGTSSESCLAEELLALPFTG